MKSNNTENDSMRKNKSAMTWFYLVLASWILLLVQHDEWMFDTHMNECIMSRSHRNCGSITPKIKYALHKIVPKWIINTKIYREIQIGQTKLLNTTTAYRTLVEISSNDLFSIGQSL